MWCRWRDEKLKTVISPFTHEILSLLVSLDSIVQDVRSLERGMEVTRREFSVENNNPVLQKFISSNTQLLDSLKADGKTAQVTQLYTTHVNSCCVMKMFTLRSVLQDVYESAVEYFGENPKTTPPSMFFPVFVRFIKAYKVRTHTSLLYMMQRLCSTTVTTFFFDSKLSRKTSRRIITSWTAKLRRLLPNPKAWGTRYFKHSLITCPSFTMYWIMKSHILLLFQLPTMSKLPQMDLIAELKKRQVSPLVREGKDGAIEDIITGTQQPEALIFYIQ